LDFFVLLWIIDTDRYVLLFLGQIEDVPGNDEITLLRQFGNEQYVWVFASGPNF
jgi:hypothetical protein